MGAMITERAQFHQGLLVQSATSYSPNMEMSLQNWRTRWCRRGSVRPTRCIKHWAGCTRASQMQAQTLAYIDTFWGLALIALCLIPLVLFLRNVRNLGLDVLDIVNYRVMGSGQPPEPSSIPRNLNVRRCASQWICFRLEDHAGCDDGFARSTPCRKGSFRPTR